MKNRITILVLISAWLALLSCGQGPKKTEFKIKAMIGKVTILSDDQKKKVKVGDVLLQGDTVVTGPRSMAVILIGKRGVINVSQNTHLVINESIDGKVLHQNLDMDKGKVFVSLSRNKSRTFSVKTPTVTASVRGTSFRVSADKEKSRLDVVNGTVRLAARDGDEESKKGAVQVTAGKTAQVHEKDREPIVDGEKTIAVKKLDPAAIREISEENNTLKHESMKKSLNGSAGDDLDSSLERLRQGIKGFSKELVSDNENNDGGKNLIRDIRNREKKEQEEYDRNQSNKKNQ